MKKSALYILCISLLVFAGCEKIIDIDLDETDPRLVVEGFVTLDSAFVKLTTTGNFFEESIFPAVSGADITLTDNSGNIYIIPEIYPGYYSVPIQGEVGKRYTLKINVEGEEYEALTSIPEPGLLDSLSYEFRQPTIFSDSGYFVILYQTDRPVLGEYFMLKQYLNDTLEASSSYLVYQDEFFNGTSFAFTFFEPRAIGDKVTVELWTLDKKGYDFFNTLNETIENNNGSPFSGTPQNPLGNISNGALGFFGGVNIVRETITIF